MILDVVIVLFVFLELGNVMILYFSPNSKQGNGVAVFNPWFKSKHNETEKLFVKYLVNWVAGSKLIFIGLLLVVLFTASETTKLWAVMVMSVAIATYYFRLHPYIKQLDVLGEITPKGYSKKLLIMITSFIVLFVLASVIQVFFSS